MSTLTSYIHSRPLRLFVVPWGGSLKDGCRVWHRKGERNPGADGVSVCGFGAWLISCTGIVCATALVLSSSTLFAGSLYSFIHPTDFVPCSTYRFSPRLKHGSCHHSLPDVHFRLLFEPLSLGPVFVSFEVGCRLWGR